MSTSDLNPGETFIEYLRDKNDKLTSASMDQRDRRVGTLQNTEGSWQETAHRYAEESERWQRRYEALVTRHESLEERLAKANRDHAEATVWSSRHIMHAYDKVANLEETLVGHSMLAYPHLWLWHVLFDGTWLCRCWRSREMKNQRTTWPSDEQV
jgi:predicted RNase H-like nuclease (RuvC/YqgF family)